MDPHPLSGHVMQASIAPHPKHPTRPTPIWSGNRSPPSGIHTAGCCTPKEGGSQCAGHVCLLTPRPSLEQGEGGCGGRWQPQPSRAGYVMAQHVPRTAGLTRTAQAFLESRHSSWEWRLYTRGMHGVGGSDLSTIGLFNEKSGGGVRWWPPASWEVMFCACQRRSASQAKLTLHTPHPHLAVVPSPPKSTVLLLSPWQKGLQLQKSHHPQDSCAHPQPLGAKNPLIPELVSLSSPPLPKKAQPQMGDVKA